MTIQKKTLLESLKNALPGVESGNVVIQGADTFAFHDGKIFSYNDAISVTVPIDSEGLVTESIEGVVHADEFFKVISKFPGDEISLEVSDDGKSWNLKCGKAKAQMTLIDFDFNVRLKGVTPDENSWIEVTEELFAGIGGCKMSVNKTPLSGVYVSGKYIVSSDGYQINRFEMKENDLPTFWISDSSVMELMKIKGFNALQIQDSWVHFKTEDGTVFSIKTLNKDKFPFEKINQILETSNFSDDDLHANFPAELFNAIDRAGSFSIEISGHTSVRLTLSSEGIEVSSERTTGKYSELIPWDEGISVNINPVTVYVDATMMQFMAQRSLEFYLIKGQMRNGKALPRLLFVSLDSKHLMSTFDLEG